LIKTSNRPSTELIVQGIKTINVYRIKTYFSQKTALTNQPTNKTDKSLSNDIKGLVFKTTSGHI
jgi:hypothetical protein